MKRVLRRTFISAAVILATYANAFEPPIKIEELPVLTQEEQHSEASKRLINLFTRSHYKSIEFNDDFAVCCEESFVANLPTFRCEIPWPPQFSSVDKMKNIR